MLNWAGLFAIVYVNAGFLVYWLITGSTTIGVGGRMTNLGGLVMFAPLMLWFGCYVIGPRGVFKRAWYPDTIVTVADSRLSWVVDGLADAIAWSEVERIEYRFGLRDRNATGAKVLDTGGHLRARLPYLLIEIGTPSRRRLFRKKQRLVDVVAAMLPDTFEAQAGWLGRRTAVRHRPTAQNGASS